MSDPMSSTFANRVRRPGADAEPPPLESPGRRRRLWSILPACAGFAVFGAIVWLAYQDASLGPPVGEPPLIKAAAEPIKLPPDQAQQTTLAAEQGTIGRLWSDAEQADQPERLLPPPEEPLAPPVVEQPAIAEQVLEQPAAQPASEPAAGSPAMEAGREDADAGVAAVPSEVPAAIPDSAALQPSSDESLQPSSDESLEEAEAALDRLLAEVTGVSEDADAPGAPPAPAEAAPGDMETPADREESPPGEPATTTAVVPTAERAAPAVPPEKPAAEAPAAAPRASPEVRPAGAVSGAPAAGAPAPERSTETAALSGAGPPLAPPPIVPDGDFRIQLAAVRGEDDARRAWNLFMVDLGPVLSRVEPIFERAETANGVFYRVQIGPFASQETAENLCDELKQRNASCFVISR